MEHQSLAISGVSLCIGVVIGWQAKGDVRVDPPPCACACHCGCQCESSLSWTTALCFLVVLGVIGLIAVLTVQSKTAAETFPSPSKGKKGVFGQTGKVLSITG